MFLQVVFPRFDHREHFTVTGAVGGGNFHKFAAGKVLASHTARGIADVLHTAGGHDLAAMHTGTGADIHNIVRLAHGVPRRALLQSGCCPGRAGASWWQSAYRYRADAGRCWVHPAHTARRSVRCRSGSPGGCAGFRRRKGTMRRETGSSTPDPRSSKSPDVL